MWKYINQLDESLVDSLWGEYKDIPYIFDDETFGDFEKFKEKTLDPMTRWYQINDGYIMLSDFHLNPEMAVWHTLVKENQLSYVDAWHIMLDAFERFEIRLIVSGVPSFHPRALRASEKAGFVVIQVRPNFVKRWGHEYAMHFMAIDKETVLCRLSSQLQLQL